MRGAQVAKHVSEVVKHVSESSGTFRSKSQVKYALRPTRILFLSQLITMRPEMECNEFQHIKSQVKKSKII